MVDYKHLQNSNTSTSSGNEEGYNGSKKLVQLISLTGFVIIVVLGIVYGITVLMNGSEEEASHIAYAIVFVASLAMIVPAVLIAILICTGQANANKTRGSELDVIERSQQPGDSATLQTIFRELQMPTKLSNSQELYTSPAGVREPISSQTNETIERFLIEMAREIPIRFTRQELENFTCNFSERLGAGGFGIVYKGELRGAGIAVKVLQRNVDKRVKEQFMAEVSTIGRTNHKNLVKLYGFCFDQSMKALVYEYLENGSLHDFMFSAKLGSLHWEKLLNIAIGTAKGIAYLHEDCQQRIIHYDIKPGNVLLDTNWSPKVADFGLAKLCGRDNTHVTMSGARGTPGYAAPELWFPKPVTEKCDVYSYGMLLFEIVGRRKNLNINMSNESQEWFPRWVWKNHEQQNWEAILLKCGAEEQHKSKVKDVLLVAMWCVQYSPEFRPTMSCVVKMLEGGMEVPSPPNPFHHLSNIAVAEITSQSESNSTSSASTMEENETTPIMKKYEIEIAY